MLFLLGQLYIYREIRENGHEMRKTKCIARYFVSLFSHFAPLFLLFTFHSILGLSRHSCEKSKDFVVYFFAALIKHKIHMKWENMISECFVFCGVLRKHLRNVKSVGPDGGGGSQ